MQFQIKDISLKMIEKKTYHMKTIKAIILLISVWGCLVSCQQSNSGNQVLVSNQDELDEAISKAQPGDEIVMANGSWDDVRIKLVGQGTEKQPITLRAESPGKVLVQGKSDLKLGGEYLIVDGLHFTNGASPSQAVIQFFIDSKNLANHSRVTNCVIEDFNKPQRNMQDYWVLFKGRYNQLDHCYLAGKSNRGPTIRLNLTGNQSINNYHKINNNHFGPRPPKGGPSAETIQLGTSQTSVSPSYTQVYDNFFDRCNGEVEVISSKTNFNEFRNNVFYKSEGSLVTRHGNYCTIDGNFFIGDDSPHVGGVRLIGTGHWVTNNYFYNLRGEIFRGPLAVMNGIPKSSLNRYIQVTDVVVAHNTWVNCTSPWQFGVGSNIDQKDVLPPSEIRSETPIRTLVANNIIHNSTGDKVPLLRYDSIDGIEFVSNVINNQGVGFRGVNGLLEKDFSLIELSENIFIPSTDLDEVEVHNGFEFDKVNKDLFGNTRGENNSVGATNGMKPDFAGIMNLEKYGPSWYDSQKETSESNTHMAANEKELRDAIAKSSSGDIINLVGGEYRIDESLVINKKLLIQSSDSMNKSVLIYDGAAETPAFEMNPKGELTLESVILRGNRDNYAFASLKENMSSLYNLKVVDTEISNFDYVLKAYKYSFAEYIEFESTKVSNCANGIELSSENDDKGEYNAENVFILNSQFDRVGKNVIDYYRGGYDESTVGGNLIVKGSTFTGSGRNEANGVLINTYGIINVDISDNSFKNNNIKLVARLWGAKNNSHSNNEIENSGRLIVEQNLPLKLVY